MKIDAGIESLLLVVEAYRVYLRGDEPP